MSIQLFQNSRFEDKYLLKARSTGGIISYLHRFGVPDPHGVDGKYQVTSLYFDTRDLLCYHDYKDGKLNRFKLRLRSYDAFKTSFLEVKIKENQLSYKSRSSLLVDPENFILPPFENLSPLKYQFLKKLSFRPSIYTKYDRYAFMLDNFRITLDTNLSFATFRTDPLWRHSSVTVLEIKGEGKYTPAMQVLIKTHDLRRSSFSKYAKGIEELGLV